MADDMYDFSGVSVDLAVLRSQLMSLQIGHNSYSRGHHGGQFSFASAMDKTDEEDDEEWYPPSPPVYDVADKLVEVNRDFCNDPTSTMHLANRLRWKQDLVQIRWLYSDSDTEESSNQSECGGSGDQSVTMVTSLVEDRLLLSNRDYDEDDMVMCNGWMDHTASIEEDIVIAAQPPKIEVSPPFSSEDLYADDFEDDDVPEKKPIVVVQVSKPKKKAATVNNVCSSNDSSGGGKRRHATTKVSNGGGRSIIECTTTDNQPKIVLDQQSISSSSSSNSSSSTARDNNNKKRSKSRSVPTLTKSSLPPPTPANTSNTRIVTRPLLQRKISRNSLSSNSSVSSQTTEDSITTSDSSSQRRRPGQVVHHHPGVVADVMSPSDSFAQWKLRKREEKRLRERRTYLEHQMRRH